MKTQKMIWTLSMVLLAVLFATLVMWTIPARKAYGAATQTQNAYWDARKTHLIQKIVLSGTIASSETITLNDRFWGNLERVILDVTGTDAAWSIAIADTSGKNYYTKSISVSGTDYDEIVEALSANGNYYGGPPCGYSHTITVSNADSLTGLTIWLYYTAEK